MGRTRMIKPAFFKHAELYEAERDSGLPLRVAFAGLWTVADRAGRFRWKVDLKPDVLPYDDVSMLAVLGALEAGGFVTSYVVEGKRYGLIPSFSDHQTFHKTERGSTIPAPLVNGGSPVLYTPDTGTVAGTQVLVVGADEAPQELTPIYLAICANGAVAETWGEQPSPYTPAQATAPANELLTLGVEAIIVKRSIYRQCRESKQKRPPQGPAYFKPGIVAEWEGEIARRQLAQSGERPPPVASAAPFTGARRESWKAEDERREQAEGLARRIKDCSGNVQTRRLAQDGAEWWERMQREAKATNANEWLYAFDRIHESAEDVAHV